jgi:hypothetical protein
LSETTPNALVPQAAEWMRNNLNVMLVGLHGVGKTQAIRETAEELGIRVKYFSCSTLDPYTDLVGVPFPKEDESGTHLQMVRPRDVDDAELIFFDEFNRADPKVHNAVLEIVQFQTINGEKLPHARMVWAAMNPPGKEYDVEDLDPALVDRFDVYEEVKATPSVTYLAGAGMSQNVAEALCAWWRDQQPKGGKRDVASAITPRRLEKIGQVWTLTGECKNTIPLWIKCDRGKLRQMLQQAQAKDDASAVTTASTGSAQTGAYQGIDYNDKWIRTHEFETAEYLRDHQEDLMTHHAVKAVLDDRTGGALATHFATVAAALTPSVLEALVTGMSDGKLLRLHRDLGKVSDDRAPLVQPFIDAVATDAERRAEETS